MSVGLLIVIGLAAAPLAAAEPDVDLADFEGNCAQTIGGDEA